MHQLGDGKDDGGRRGDVAHKEHPRAPGHAGPHGFHNLLLRSHRQLHRLTDVARATLAADEAPRPVQRAVLVIGGQHLISRAQWQRTGYDVQPSGRVRHIDQVILICTDELTQCRPGLPHQIPPSPAEEIHRLTLQFQLPGLVRFKDRSGTCAIGTVVEVHDIGS